MSSNRDLQKHQHDHSDDTKSLLRCKQTAQKFPKEFYFRRFHEKVQQSIFEIKLEKIYGPAFLRQTRRNWFALVAKAALEASNKNTHRLRGTITHAVLFSARN